MKVNFCVFGSNIASWRSLLSIGNALAYGLSEPLRQNAGVPGA